MNQDHEKESTDSFLRELSLFFESEDLRWEMNHSDSYDCTKTSYLDSYIDSKSE